MRTLAKLQPLALLLLRAALGVIFISHGFPKLFTRTAEAVKFFTSLGLPGWLVHAAGVAEFLCGWLLIAGVFTRIAALLLAGEMAVAIEVAHSARGILAVTYYVFPLALEAAAFVLATPGAGVISFDRLIGKDKG
jgi:putative oxidoreductase